MSELTEEKAQEITNAVLRLLPDNPQEALGLLGFMLAHIALTIGLPEAELLSALQKTFDMIRSDYLVAANVN